MYDNAGWSGWQTAAKLVTDKLMCNLKNTFKKIN